jgi:hypothetical protein
VRVRLRLEDRRAPPHARTTRLRLLLGQAPLKDTVVSTFKFNFRCSECGGTGKQEVWCSCECPNCNGPRRYSADGRRQLDLCPECHGKFRKWFGGRCRRCVGGVLPVCRVCRGTGRDPSCPECNGINRRSCWCSLTGLRDVKCIDLAAFLPSLLEVENSVSFQHDYVPGGNTNRPAAILTLDQVVSALQHLRAEVVGHVCANGYRCKENWLRAGGESGAHRTTAVLLDVFPNSPDRRRPIGSREIRRVGPSQFICVGSSLRGMHRVTWDAGRGIIEPEKSSRPGLKDESEVRNPVQFPVSY